MPSKNLVKQYAPDNYYHIYSRGVEKRTIFLDNQDRTKFMKIINRYLDKNTSKEQSSFKKFHDTIDINAFCLMDNHIHLMVYMKDSETAITDLMRRVMTSYVMYFNKKYDRVGPLFQSTFKASIIKDESYLLHLSRYIHLNTADYLKDRFSSIAYYLGKPAPEWLKIDNALAGMRTDEYIRFLQDYESEKQRYLRIKYLLANNKK